MAEHHSTVSEPYNDPLSDVFHSIKPSHEPDGPSQSHLSSALSAHPSDDIRLRGIHGTQGYRDGITSSKAAHVQIGFDEGYSLGAALGLIAGQCLGSLSALRDALPDSVAPETTAPNTHRDRIAEVPETRSAVDMNQDWGSEDHMQALDDALRDARRELSVTSLFGSDFFGPDGVWIYAVPGENASQNSEEITFDRVAAAHPLIVKWLAALDRFVTSLGLDFKMPTAQKSHG